MSFIDGKPIFMRINNLLVEKEKAEEEEILLLELYYIK
jgi:hypothetical protein